MANFLYGGARPKKILYNGAEVKKVIYDGVVIWTAGLEAGSLEVDCSGLGSASSHRETHKDFVVPEGCRKIYAEVISGSRILKSSYIRVSAGRKLALSIDYRDYSPGPVIATYSIGGKRYYQDAYRGGNLTVSWSEAINNYIGGTDYGTDFCNVEFKVFDLYPNNYFNTSTANFIVPADINIIYVEVGNKRFYMKVTPGQVVHLKTHSEVHSQIGPQSWYYINDKQCWNNYSMPASWKISWSIDGYNDYAGTTEQY